MEHTIAFLYLLTQCWMCSDPYVSDHGSLFWSRNLPVICSVIQSRHELL